MREKDIQKAIIAELNKHPLVAWCYVTSAGRVQVGKYWMTLGFEGLSDIIGQMRSVGLIDGRLLAIEVKQPGKEPTPSQVEFLNKVRRNGGISGVAHNVEEAMEIIIN